MDYLPWQQAYILVISQRWRNTPRAPIIKQHQVTFHNHGEIITTQRRPRCLTFDLRSCGAMSQAYKNRLHCTDNSFRAGRTHGEYGDKSLCFLHLSFIFFFLLVHLLFICLTCLSSFYLCFNFVLFLLLCLVFI